ncbi:MAG: TrmB family transcriptional regulator [Candidatus Bathyarchaeia archaeon]
MKGQDKDPKTSIELFRLLGITDNESYIYLKLLEKPKGELIDNVLSSFDLPSHEAEVAVKSLAEKGCVSIRSNMVEAKPPRDFLPNILKEKRMSLDRQLRQIQDAAILLEKTLDPYYWEKSLGIKPEELIAPLMDLPLMEKQTVDMISRAEDYILIFAGRFDWYENIRESIRDAVSRTVDIHVLMLIKDKYTTKRAEELMRLGIKVRHCAEEWYPVRGTLIDDSELIFLIWATRKVDVERPTYYRPHYTRNPGLIRIFKDAFQKRWDEAKTI